MLLDRFDSRAELAGFAVELARSLPRTPYPGGEPSRNVDNQRGARFIRFFPVGMRATRTKRRSANKDTDCVAWRRNSFQSKERSTVG